MLNRFIQPQRLLLILSVAAFGLGAGVPAARAELREVDQKVFGMDCAPCAYGMERGLGRLKGVTGVKVSLNDAKAVLELAPENKVTIQKIREVIRNGGFDPRQAHVRAVGALKLEKDEDRRLLVLGSGKRFVLRPAEATDDKQRNESVKRAWQKLQQLEPGQRVEIRGVVPKSEAEKEKADSEREPVGLRLHVERVKPVQEGKQEKS